MLARRQQNFLLSITHELKTPIATIKLYLQTLQKRVLDKEKQEEAYETMSFENDRLNTLVGKMLLAAKMEDATFALTKENVNLSSVIRHIAKRYDNKNVNWELMITPEIFFNVDSESIETIVTNLIDNALKYGGTSIHIQLTRKNGFIELSISDNGIGIATKEQEAIFDRFYRIGSEDTRKTKGTGLGLYIVKTLVKMHNGVITVSNNTPKGTIFNIQFKPE